jgi:predicted ATP-dependent endonuclease of OLD family
MNSFKTIATPQELLLDGRATILVGANESGKTNVLQVIELISPLKKLTKDDISKINRDRCVRKELPYLTYTFSLLKQETEKISKIVPELSDEKELTIFRNGNDIENFSILINSRDFVPKLQAAESKLQDERQKLEIKLQAATNEYQLLTANPASKVGTAVQSNDWSKNAKRILVLTEELKVIPKEINKIIEKIDSVEAEALVASENNILLVNRESMTSILKLLPDVVYFAAETVPASIPISEIKEQKTPQAKSIGNLLKIGNLTDFVELDESYRTLKHTLKSVSETISRRFNEFWSQEEIEIEIERQGNDLAVSVNGGVSVASSPEERSVGLQWILSFFANFANLHPDWKNTIFLIDEPAVLLHPRGQKDVLNVIEKMTQKNQIIYSTHSPFLINRNYPHRIRLLTKDPEKGTLINNKPYSDGKMRFWEPLRSSIGICLGDMLSMGEKNIIVEGISEQIIITRISKKFADLDYPFIDLEKFSIVPAMGATCEEALARFAISEGLAAVSLLDNDSEGQRVARHLRKDKQIKLIMISEIKKDAVTIEDLFPEDDYINAFNQVYSRFDDFKNYFKGEKADKNGTGIVERLEKHLRNINYSKLDKVAVANTLIGNLELSDKNVSLYSSFQELFVALDKL